MNNLNEHDHDDIFNFVGECNLNNVQYLIKISLNAQEIVHVAKVFSTSIDSTFKQRVDDFLHYIDGKTLEEAEKFFTSNSKIPNISFDLTSIDPLYYAWQRGLLDYSGELSLLKKKVKDGDLLCSCAGLSTTDFTKMRDSQRFTMETLVKETKAGTGCGACRADLKSIMQTFQDFPALTASSYMRLWKSINLDTGEFLCRCKKVPLSEIAEVLERHNQEDTQQLFLKLQVKYGIGLSCSNCESSVKKLLSAPAI